VDVRQDSASGNGDASEELVELLVVAHGELHVAWNDAPFLVVAGSVAGELEDLGRKVLEHGSEVHGRPCAYAIGVPALLEIAVYTPDGELETCLLGAGDGLATLGLATACRALAYFARLMVDSMAEISNLRLGPKRACRMEIRVSIWIWKYGLPNHICQGLKLS